MIQEMICDYYIARIKDSWYRLGFHSSPQVKRRPLTTLASKEEHIAFLASLGSRDTVFLGSLPLPIKQDIDVQTGLGTKYLGHCRVVTCKSVGMMMTLKKQDKPMMQRQKEAITSILRRQRELLESKGILVHS